HEIVPLYYDRDSNGVPKRWIDRVRRSLMTIGPVYNTQRMVAEYAENFYRKAAEKGRMFEENKFAKSRDLAVWKDRMRNSWAEVKANGVTWAGGNGATVSVGDQVSVTAQVHLGSLKNEEVAVEAYMKAVDPNGPSMATRLEPTGEVSQGWAKYAGRLEVKDSGNFQFNVRVRPSNSSLTQAHELRLITWAANS
ncbi:MAG: hypothetical protein EBT95_09005, partial [Verrucomicrobia bacterium]|nr:hypothetical protein [Verrucomicrobiota bacterium]